MPHVRFAIRREETAKYLKYFEAPEIAIVALSMVFYLPLVVLTTIPPWFLPILIFGPLLAYIGIFRYKRPKNYFIHWLKFHVRSRYWRYSPRGAFYLLSTRERLAEVWQARKQNSKWWTGPGEPRWSEKSCDTARENPFVARVEAGRRAIKEMDET